MLNCTSKLDKSGKFDFTLIFSKCLYIYNILTSIPYYPQIDLHMILKQTRLIVADNTGGRVAMCIGMLGKPDHVASIGRIINVAIKEAKPIPSSEHAQSHSTSSTAGKVKQGQVHRALVIRTRKEFQRPDGRVVRFDDNACILLTPDHKPLGTRVIGPVPAELKKGNWLKVLSLSSKII